MLQTFVAVSLITVSPCNIVWRGFSLSSSILPSQQHHKCSFLIFPSHAEWFYVILSTERVRQNVSFYTVNRLPSWTIQDSNPRRGRFFCFPECLEGLWGHPAHYQRVQGSLARPTSRYILFDGENISFDSNLVIYVNSINIPPIMIINRIYETQNLLSL